jgi:hypothetical protein
MAIIEQGRLERQGWVVGHMGIGPKNTEAFGVKWMIHPAGPAGDGTWSACLNPGTKTLAVLISGHFRIHFREPGSDNETPIELREPGAFVLFDPPTLHRSEAITESTFLTIRWPSREQDCGSTEEEPWKSATDSARFASECQALKSRAASAPWTAPCCT